jgi:multimeric flavodoxin WrbA
MEVSMSKVIAFNGSPNMEKGDTEMVLSPFLKGVNDAGSNVETIYVNRLKIKPCTCNKMYCWYEKPGECCIKDEMDSVYEKLKSAEIVIFATPVYIPLPGGMQKLINRLCPIFEPLLETRDGRTRGRVRNDVKVKKIVLVSTGGWWEKENFDVVIHIVKEFAENGSIDFSGAVIRPHAFMMKIKGELTEDGEEVMNALYDAGQELIKNGKMSDETLNRISRPLIKQEELRRKYNALLRRVSK